MDSCDELYKLRYILGYGIAGGLMSSKIVANMAAILNFFNDLM